MTADAPRLAREPLAWRLSGFYAAYFLAIGLYLPFWPLWLDSRGLSATEIGWVLAAAFWVKVAAQPLVAGLVDRRGRTRRVTTSLMVLSAGGFAVLAGLDAFPALLIVSALTAACYQPVLPVMESVALRHADTHKLDYGRIRLWGSVAFIAATVGGGWWLDGRTPQSVVWLMTGTMALVALSCAMAPDRPGRPVRAQQRTAWSAMVRPGVLLFLVTAGLINTSHTVLYGFATLHWRGLGHSETLIGFFWAVGVMAEIGLFFAAGRYLRRLNAAALLALAALGGAVRWPLLAIATDPVALLFLQTLHGLTFGAGHLGAMTFLLRTIPQPLAATGQSLYSALIGGVLGGCMLPVAGLLYADLAADAFLVMGAMSATALVAAAALYRIWRAEPA